MSATFKLARLLEVLRAGEVLATDVASRQAQLADAGWMARALKVQAAQERGHAAMAAAALTLTGMRGAQKGMAHVTAPLRARIEHDLATGNLADSLLGLQGVVEHLGEALLEALGRYEHPAGVILHALRVKVLAQERGHVPLGARCLQALAPPGGTTAGALDDYRALGRAAAIQVANLLDDARLDANVFWHGVDARLSHWQRPSSGRHAHMPRA